MSARTTALTRKLRARRNDREFDRALREATPEGARDLLAAAAAQSRRYT